MSVKENLIYILKSLGSFFIGFALIASSLFIYANLGDLGLVLAVIVALSGFGLILYSLKFDFEEIDSFFSD